MTNKMKEYIPAVILFVITSCFVVLMSYCQEFGTRCASYFDRGPSIEECIERLADGDKMSEILRDNEEDIRND